MATAVRPASVTGSLHTMVHLAPGPLLAVRPRPAGLAKPVRRVVFTCDLLRFSLGPQGYKHAQTGNLRWLAALLGAMTNWSRWGVETRFVEPPATFEQLATQVRSPSVLKEYSDNSPLAWARRYDGDILDTRPALADELLDSDLVIGFELPPAMKRLINRHGGSYISFHIHALRFLRDLCLGASTNDPWLLAQLGQVAVSGVDAELQSRRFVALMTRHAFPALQIPDGWPLVIGQTVGDSILIENGRFADWPDFDDELAIALQPYPGCVLLEHPFRADTGAVAQHLRARFGKTVMMSNANGYGVVFQSRTTPQALTLSSSLGVEAQTIGLPTTFLLGDPRLRLQLAGVDLGTSEALHHGVLSSSFWQTAFGANPGEAQSTAHGALPFALGDDFIRRGIESWSYAQLQTGFAAVRSRKVVFPAADLTAEMSAQLALTLSGQVAPVQGWGTPAPGNRQDLGVDLVFAAPAVVVGAQLQLSCGDPWSCMVLEGFHAPEGWGAWSSGRESKVCLSIAPSAVELKAELTVRLKIELFEALRPRCPVCRISENGQTLALLFFRPGGPKTVDVVVRTVARSTRCEIDFVLSDIDSPKNLAGMDDTRLLGFGLLAVQVRACLPGEQERPPRAPEGSLIWGVTPEPSPLEPEIGALE